MTQFESPFTAERPTDFDSRDIGRLVSFGKPDSLAPEEGIIARIVSIKHTEEGTRLKLSADGETFKRHIRPLDSIRVAKVEHS